jgi:1-acyl-sn-glycerol-3-phosphate acyltransferase
VPLYWLVRTVLQPPAFVLWRPRAAGRRHLPPRGEAAILASNHRSFLDAVLLDGLPRRPLHFMAKREIFDVGWQARLANALGAFPVERGVRDGESLETARAVLARGGWLLMFPEGRRVRTGRPGPPRPGVGRLALQTGVPVVPLAIAGTAGRRRGRRLRPGRVRVSIGPTVRFPRVADPTDEQATAATAVIWSAVETEWDRLETRWMSLKAGG